MSDRLKLIVDSACSTVGCLRHSVSHVLSALLDTRGKRPYLWSSSILVNNALCHCKWLWLIKYLVLLYSGWIYEASGIRPPRRANYLGLSEVMWFSRSNLPVGGKTRIRLSPLNSKPSAFPSRLGVWGWRGCHCLHVISLETLSRD